ncbi:MAG: asparaginase [Acidothermaceae bacterium]
MTNRPRITVFSLGGTIASMPDDAGVAGAAGPTGVTPQLDASDLLAAIPSVGEIADIEAVAFRQVASCELTLTDCVALATEIQTNLNAGAAGVVVAQGTDTIEETSFALDLLLDVSQPVVITGAMRAPSKPGADGAANLLAAVRVAASDGANGLGCVVVMNDEVHAARFVRKADTSSPAAFASAGTGAIGWVVEGRPHIVVRPVRLEPHGLLDAVTMRGDAPIPRVALIKVGLGDDGALLKQIEPLGYAGLVVEAMGGGHVPSGIVAILDDLAGRMPVVLASRAGAGEVLRVTYSYSGSEVDLLDRGLVRAGYLDGLKARILLSLLLAAGSDSRAIAAALAHFSA